MSTSGPAFAAAAPFAADAVRLFRFSGWSLDAASGRIALDYALEGGARRESFREEVDLGVPVAGLSPERRAALERAIGVLHLVAGVSYYKASFAPAVVIEDAPIGAMLANLLRGVYGPGLAECRHANGLAGRALPDFASFVAPPRHAGSRPFVRGLAPRADLPDRPLVPVGGGKDSIVTLEAVRRAGAPPLLFSVGAPAAVLRTVEVAGLEHVTVRRRLDPRLLELNRLGAYNGHVPVTAINSCLAVIAALVHGASAVIMANERSASAPSFRWDGVDVNHQWSKSWECEQRLTSVVSREIAGDLDYFSLLRAWSELAIARSFATMPRYHHAFISCNRAYLLDSDRRTPSWCGDCPKCRFVALALAPFLDRDSLVGIIGRDLLADPAQTAGFAALLGLDADKPLECVGEIEESRVAMHLAARSAGWRDAHVVATLSARPEVRGLGPAVIEAVFAPAEPRFPGRYHDFPVSLP
jgi:hypothetical protein